MRPGILAGRRRSDRSRADALAARTGIPVVTPADLPGHDRVLVVGDDADLARAVWGCPPERRPAFALAGPGSVTTLFAHDPGSGAALQRLHDGAEYPMDVAVATIGGVTHPVVGVIRAGAGAEHPGAFPWWGRSGPVSVAAARDLAVADARALTVANGQVTGAFTVAPRSAAMDGRFDIHVFAGSRRACLRLRPALRAGMHERSHLVRRVSATAAVLTIPAAWRVAADGVVIGRGPFAVAITPGAFRLLV